ncbi:MAG: hypothetical protein AAFZ35_19165 [Cyanobacteria bacterium J06649_12]
MSTVPMNLLTAQTADDFTQLGKELIDIQALLQAQAYELTEHDTVPDWMQPWPVDMQTVFCCPTWNQWMVQQLQQWQPTEDQIPLTITNLVKATVFYLRSSELDQLPT